MTEKYDRAVKEILAAVRRGEAKRRAATAESALALVKQTIDRQLFHCTQHQGTDEWIREVHAIAHYKLTELQNELGDNHPLSIEWADLLDVIYNQLKDK